MAFEDLRKMKEEYEAKIAAEGEALLKDAFKGFFEKYGDKVVAVRWVQYTPHFNDGDPCTFSVHDFEYQLKGEDDFEDKWSLKGDKIDPAVIEEWGNFESEFPEDLLEAVFGDGIQVTVTAEKIDSEEYSHD